MIKIRVAYYGVDRFGTAAVMLSHDYHDPARPGWTKAIAQKFEPVADLQHAQAVAERMKRRGQVDLVKAL